VGIKAEKDRQQAAFLIDILAEDRLDDLIAAGDAAVAAGPRWQGRPASSLTRVPGRNGVSGTPAGPAGGERFSVGSPPVCSLARRRRRL